MQGKINPANTMKQFLQKKNSHENVILPSPNIDDTNLLARKIEVICGMIKS